MGYWSSRYWSSRYWASRYWGVLGAAIITVEAIMADPLAIRPWYAGLFSGITTPVNLSTLLKALYAGFSQAIIIPDITALEVHIYADAGNTSHPVLIGDEHLSTTNYADKLAAGARDHWGPFNVSNFPLESVYVMSDDGTTAVKVGLQVFVG